MPHETVSNYSLIISVIFDYTTQVKEVFMDIRGDEVRFLLIGSLQLEVHVYVEVYLKYIEHRLDDVFLK